MLGGAPSCSTGHAWGWGLNGAGDLCLPDLVHTRPQQIPLTHVTLATGARTHALFDSDATLYACDNSDGQLGTERNHRVETLPVNVNIHLTQVSSTAQNVAGQQ